MSIFMLHKKGTDAKSTKSTPEEEVLPEEEVETVNEENGRQRLLFPVEE